MSGEVACPICDKKYRDLDLMHKHLYNTKCRRSLNLTMFECECGKDFASTSTLKKHRIVCPILNPTREAEKLKSKLERVEQMKERTVNGNIDYRIQQLEESFENSKFKQKIDELEERILRLEMKVGDEVEDIDV